MKWRKGSKRPSIVDVKMHDSGGRFGENPGRDRRAVGCTFI